MRMTICPFPPFTFASLDTHLIPFCNMRLQKGIRKVSDERKEIILKMDYMIPNIHCHTNIFKLKLTSQNGAVF